MADNKTDNRTPEEIAEAQKTLVKILAIATAIPVLWVTFLASHGLLNPEGAAASPGGEGRYWFTVVWGVLSPVVWLVCNGYTWNQLNKGNMEAGRFAPVIPALWIIFWFAAGMVG